MTNFEKIKSMNVEEIHSFLLEHERENCKHCIYIDCDDCAREDCTDCRIGLMQWLNSECEMANKE